MNSFEPQTIHFSSSSGFAFKKLSGWSKYAPHPQRSILAFGPREGRITRRDHNPATGLRRFMTLEAERNEDEEEMSTTSSTAGGAGRIFSQFR
jgi:hypothetical protein